MARETGSVSPGVRTKGGKSGSSVRSEPFEHLIQHIKQTDPMLYEALRRASSQIVNISNYGTPDGTTITPEKQKQTFQRTLLLKDLTVGDDIADHVDVYGASKGGTSTITRITAVLRRTIVADLTLRIKADDVEIGTFTVPLGTGINSVQTFTSFLHSSLPDKAVLSWDVTASDGSIDAGGIASFTVEWQPD